MIEPTAEMLAAFRSAEAADDECAICDVCLNHRLAAVLAIVARDRCMQPRDHAGHPLAAPGLAVCGAPGPDGLTCQRQPHAWKRDSLHGAVRPGELVTW